MGKYSQFIKYLSSFIFILFTFSNFQNCSTKTRPLYLDSINSNLDLSSLVPSDHPATVPVGLIQQKKQIVNRDYVKALFNDIFSSPGKDSNDIEALVEIWVNKKASQFGLGCDSYSSYSGSDCGGSISSSNLPVYIVHNTVRESYHLQLCQNILSLDKSIHFVLEKIEKPLSVPDPNAIIQIYNLFYRSNDPEANIINSLIEFDKGLANNNEPPLERWRGLILLICESPGWQSF